MNKLNINHIASLYMIKNNKNCVCFASLLEFTIKLKNLLKTNQYKVIVDINQKLKGSLFCVKNGFISCDKNISIDDLENYLLLELNLDTLMNCYTVLGLYNPDTKKFTMPEK